MSLYEKYKDEAEFRDKFVRPLLNRLGFYGVSEQHGANEFGKDFVFSELHRLGGMRHYAAQVKHEQKISQGNSVDDLLSQIKQAFSKPFKRADSPRECHVASVYVFNSGKITDGAKEQMLAELEKERYGDNVHFLDGERLEALGQWATYSSDREVRSRLLGLQAELSINQFILDSYERMLRGNYTENRRFLMRGIERFIGEPILDLPISNTDIRELWEILSMLNGVVKNLPAAGELVIRIQQIKYKANFVILENVIPVARNSMKKVTVGIEGALNAINPLV